MSNVLCRKSSSSVLVGPLDRERTVKGTTNGVVVITMKGTSLQRLWEMERTDSNKLYDREDQIQLLHDAYERCCVLQQSTEREMVLITGPSGGERITQVSLLYCYFASVRFFSSQPLGYFECSSR
jgi:hypothetical protein